MAIGLRLGIHEIIEGIITLFQSNELAAIDAVQSLGKILRAKYVSHFKEILSSLLIMNYSLLDVTGWRFVAVKALLQVLRDMNLIIPLKIDRTVTRILKFPENELQLDSLVRSIVNNVF